MQHWRTQRVRVNAAIHRHIPPTCVRPWVGGYQRQFRYKRNSRRRFWVLHYMLQLQRQHLPAGAFVRPSLTKIKHSRAYVSCYVCTRACMYVCTSNSRNPVPYIQRPPSRYGYVQAIQTSCYLRVFVMRRYCCTFYKRFLQVGSTQPPNKLTRTKKTLTIVPTTVVGAKAGNYSSYVSAWRGVLLGARVGPLHKPSPLHSGNLSPRLTQTRMPSVEEPKQPPESRPGKDSSE